MSSEPPEEPQLRSEPNVLSPASPKPIHFPAPTNIPVLEMQMDVGFNQTEAHMSDPATRNTDVRPDFWRDPAEEQQSGKPEAAADSASPYSVGGEDASENTQEKTNGAENVAGVLAQDFADSTETAQANTAATEHNQAQREDPSFSTSASNGEQDAVPEVAAQLEMPSSLPNPDSSDPSIPNGEAATTHSVAQDVTSSSYDPAQSNAPLDSNSQVDFQALLDTLQPASALNATAPSANTAPETDGMTIATTNSPSLQAPTTPSQPQVPGVESSPLSASGLGIPPTGLPPRPPPQEQPLIHPNYVHSQHIRDYHPHASHPAFQPSAKSGSSAGEQSSTQGFVPPVPSPSTQQQSGIEENTNGSYTASQYPSNGSYDSQQPPAQQPTAATGTTPQLQQMYSQNPYTGSPQVQQAPSAGPPGTQWTTSPTNLYTPSQAYGNMAGTPMESRPGEGQQQRRPEDRPWDAEVQRKYDNFIEEERKYVSEGRWDSFPQGSRLFVGNLSSEKVTKRDIFHVFHLYGELAQISIKQAYGFVQFLRTEDCVRALEAEQGTLIRDKRIHLEVSKPQKSRNQNQNNQRRSRSPPKNDRYGSGGPRGGNNRNDRRDGYRPGYRSPSPPRGYRDRYDDRYRQRSRSPRGYGSNNRYRSPSPRRDTDDDLPLPRRSREQVPDVQIIVLDNLDRDFISWVEQAFASRVKVDVLMLSPRLSEQAVIRRQIVEGVVAVSRLTRPNQNSGKIGLQIFDRRNAGARGAENVQFEEYDNLEPNIAVELVLRAKGQQAQQGWSDQPSYQQSQYGPQQAYTYNAPPPQQPPPGSYNHPPPGYQSYNQQQPPPGQQPQNLQNLITNFDPNNLQNIMANMSSTPQTAGGYGGVPPNSAVPGQTPQSAAYQGYPQAQQQQGPPAAGQAGGQVNMQDILARLGSYQQR